MRFSARTGMLYRGLETALSLRAEPAASGLNISNPDRKPKRVGVKRQAFRVKGEIGVPRHARFLRDGVRSRPRAEPAASGADKHYSRSRSLSGVERSDKKLRPGDPLHTH